MPNPDGSCCAGAIDPAFLLGGYCARRMRSHILHQISGGWVAAGKGWWWWSSSSSFTSFSPVHVHSSPPMNSVILLFSVSSVMHSNCPRYLILENLIIIIIEKIRHWFWHIPFLSFFKSLFTTNIQRAVENREKWRKLVVKSSLVPRRSSRLKDR